MARDPGGRVLFVRHGLPGERVVAEITEEHPRWARAEAIEILEAAPERVSPPCPAAGPGRCGGCDYQHIDPSLQRDLKAQLLAEQLRRVAKVDHTVVVEAVSETSLDHAPSREPRHREHRRLPARCGRHRRPRSR